MPVLAVGETSSAHVRSRHDRAAKIAASMVVAMIVAAGFAAVSVQLVKLALIGQADRYTLQSAQPVVRNYSRPDIVDRKDRLLATDLPAYSLFADPVKVLDPDEVSEALARIFPGLDQRQQRRELADKTRRFVWIRRGLSAALAQRIHNLGFPGLGFRTEPKRRYPQGRLAGHILGSVSVDNKGLSGIERHIDVAMGLQSGLVGDSIRPPVELTIDIGVQHGLEEELATAMARYRARGAAGLMLNVESGEVLAAASLPDVDPGSPIEALEADRIDRLQVATYELGSVFKMVTVAMALELRLITPTSLIDVVTPLQAGAFVLRDPHPAGRPLTVSEIFVRSSNVGAGRLALMAGSERQRAFLARLGLLARLTSEAGTTTMTLLPERWGEAETVTISYGHGLAVAPLQFAAAAGALINGGHMIEPRFVRTAPGTTPARSGDQRVVRPEVSTMLREMMRRNVAEPGGTGHLAEVAGYDVGGKTGTAEIASGGGYLNKSVVTSFLAAFPMHAPRYLLFVVLVEPKAASGTSGQIVAGLNAAPLAAAVIRRTGPLLTLPPDVVSARDAPAR